MRREKCLLAFIQAWYTISANKCHFIIATFQAASAHQILLRCKMVHNNKKNQQVKNPAGAFILSKMTLEASNFVWPLLMDVECLEKVETLRVIN